MLPPGLFWSDAHEDLACHCQEYQRDIVDPGQVPAMITLPRLMRTGVRLVCATFFVPHEGGDYTRRSKLEGQYEIYTKWLADYPQQLRLVQSRSDLQALAAAEPVDIPLHPAGSASTAALADVDSEEAAELAYPIGIIYLMEGCDLLEGPSDLEFWHRRGLRMASLTWNGRNRFASGCFSDGAGLSSEGFELLRSFEQLGLILDLSHLCDAGVADVFRVYNGPICASHSNSRMICAHERNLTDPQAEEIAARDGVIGLNLLATFIQNSWRPGMPLPELREALDHVEHLARLCGSARVALGSDLDGGLTPENTPAGIDSISDLGLLADELMSRGWNAEQLGGFCGVNWWRFFERFLPA